MLNRLFTLKAVSPVHCGIGKIINDIDLPTARHSVSGHPVVPASSLKGVLKDEWTRDSRYKAEDADDWTRSVDSLFGRDGTKENDYASAISVGDATLVALPVRSYFGTFAYLASPYTLKGAKNAMERAGMEMGAPIPDGSSLQKEGGYLASVTEKSALTHGTRSLICLEELDLTAVILSSEEEAWAIRLASLFFPGDEEGQLLFRQRFAVVHDDVLNFFCANGLPVDARIAIDENTGTVKQGHLWYEESVPPESLFSGVVGIDRSFEPTCSFSDRELDDFVSQWGTMTFQVGGKSTTGKGLVDFMIHSEGR